MRTATAPDAVERWVSAVDHFGFVVGGTTLVAGEECDAVAAALNGRGAARRVTWGTGLALLHTADVPDLRIATPAETGLAAASVDLVVMRHAWSDQSALAAALREAYRVLKPGGGLLVGDLASDELLDSTPQRYPYLVLTYLVPELAGRLALDHVDAKRLTLEVVRAGFRDIRSYLLDDERETFDTYDAYIAFGRAGGWRGWGRLSTEDQARAVAELPDLLQRVAPLGEVRVAEPWNVSGAFKPRRS